VGRWGREAGQSKLLFWGGSMFRLHFNFRECPMFPKMAPFDEK